MTREVMSPGPLQRKWLDKLRSGKYEKTTGELFDDFNGRDCYCATGLAVLVLEEEGLVGTEEWFGSTMSKKAIRLMGIKWQATVAAMFSKSKTPSIVDINDDTRVTFSEIADRIEENWDKFFYKVA